MPPGSIRGRTAPRVVDQIQEVFLSSTAKDLEEYRNKVQDALKLSKAEVFLQETWAEPARNVLGLCLSRLAESDAYMGIFGYRYGWIPDGYDKSITELECDHALDLWRTAKLPPVFLFVPETGREAAVQLEKSANEILEQEHRDEPEKREESRRRQAQFRERLLGLNLFVRKFDSLTKLCMLAPTSVANWNVEILKNALMGRGEPSGGIPLGDLGAIGRDPQLAALNQALTALELSSSPGMCLVIHGRQGAGQLAFRMLLQSWDGWGLDDGPRVITPPHDRLDHAALRATLFNEVAPGKPLPDTFVALAAGLLAESAKIPVVMMLDRFDDLDGIEEFHRSFWAPLVAALQAKAGNTPPPNRITIVLTSLVPLPAASPHYIWPGAIDAANVDYSCLLPLPELTDLSVKDVIMWLRSLNVDPADRTAIATAVTREDGVPRNVFDRLNTNGFWARLGS